MTLDDLIDTLQTLRKRLPGKTPVVCGVDRSGYGEPVLSVNDSLETPFNEETETYKGKPIRVIDLVLSESSLVGPKD